MGDYERYRAWQRASEAPTVNSEPVPGDRCSCGHDKRDHRRNGACIATVNMGNGDAFICGCNDFDLVPPNPTKEPTNE